MKQLVTFVLFAIGAAACSAEQRTEMETEKLDSFDFTPDQREIAEALIAGYKAETGMPILRSRDYARTACYAKKVRMPPAYKRAHLLYLENYAEADKEFYEFMARHGVGEQLAWEMSKQFHIANDSCSPKALIRKKLTD